MLWSTFLLLSFFFASPILCTSAQRSPEPLPVETALSALSFGWSNSVSLSPDGKWAAYAVHDLRKGSPHDPFTPTGVSRFGVGADIWLVGTNGGDAKKVTDGIGSSSWGPAWSPDGNYLAFYSDRNGKAQLWLWDRKAETKRPISDAIIRSFLPTDVIRWTPDSRNVLVKLLPKSWSLEEAARLIGAAPASSSQTDGQRPAPLVYTNPGTVTQSPAPQYETRQLIADLGLVDISDGTVRRLAERIKPQWYDVAPDGATVAYADFIAFEGDRSQQKLLNIVFVSLRDGRVRVGAQNVRLEPSIGDEPISWAPNGQVLAYVEGGPHTKGECYLVPASDGSPRPATEQAHPSFDHPSSRPLWDANSEYIYLIASDYSLAAQQLRSAQQRNPGHPSSDEIWRISVRTGRPERLATIPSRDLAELVSSGEPGRIWSPNHGNSIYVRTLDQESKRSGLYEVNTASKQISKLAEEDKEYGSAVGLDDRVFYLAEDAQHDKNLWLSDSRSRTSRLVTNINPDFERFELGKSRIVEWRDLDGEKLRGALLLPTRYKVGSRYPLVVYLYGGFFGSNYTNRFDIDRQLLATRGYAVLFPDTPLHLGTPMRDLAATVLPGIDRVVDLGIADPERIGVMGSSYGGYSTFALVVQTTRFKAAIVKYGFSNLISLYSQMGRDGSNVGIGIAEEGQGRMGGPPWQFRERYVENSPYFFFDRVRAPLLIIHGSEDTTVPAFLGDEAFVALRRLGKEVTYVKYEGEGHGFFSYAAELDSVKRIIAWFDDHLKKPEEKKPEKQ